MISDKLEIASIKLQLDISFKDFPFDLDPILKFKYYILVTHSNKPVGTMCIWAKADGFNNIL